jgi:hypothetical protein
MARSGVCVAAALAVVLLTVSVSALSTAFFTRICKETDGGLDYPEWGKTTDMYGDRYDECVNVTFLKEWYCDNGMARSSIHKCPSGCFDGQCVGGNPNNVGAIYVCTDTDGGLNYSVRGVVEGDKEDKCLSTNRLKEWYCKNNRGESSMFICPIGCSNGACRPVPTTSTTSTTSTTTTSTTTTSTTATTTTTLAVEESTTTTLPEGSTVSSSTTTSTSTTATTSSTATTLAAECTDSDGGRYFNVKGVTASKMGTHTDACIGYKRIQEWYCSGGKSRSAYSRCQYGCADGACMMD